MQESGPTSPGTRKEAIEALVGAVFAVDVAKVEQAIKNAVVLGGPIAEIRWDGDATGDTLLHRIAAQALEANTPERIINIAKIIRLLIAAGASPLAQNNSGESPIQYISLRPIQAENRWEVENILYPALGQSMQVTPEQQGYPDRWASNPDQFWRDMSLYNKDPTEMPDQLFNAAINFLGRLQATQGINERVSAFLEKLNEEQRMGALQNRRPRRAAGGPPNQGTQPRRTTQLFEEIARDDDGLDEQIEQVRKARRQADGKQLRILQELTAINRELLALEKSNDNPQIQRGQLTALHSRMASLTNFAQEPPNQLQALRIQFQILRDAFDRVQQQHQQSGPSQSPQGGASQPQEQQQQVQQQYYPQGPQWQPYATQQRQPQYQLDPNDPYARWYPANTQQETIAQLTIEQILQAMKYLEHNYPENPVKSQYYEASLAFHRLLGAELQRKQAAQRQQMQQQMQNPVQIEETERRLAEREKIKNEKIRALQAVSSEIAEHIANHQKAADKDKPEIQEKITRWEADRKYVEGEIQRLRGLSLMDAEFAPSRAAANPANPPPSSRAPAQVNPSANPSPPRAAAVANPVNVPKRAVVDDPAASVLQEPPPRRFTPAEQNFKQNQGAQQPENKKPNTPSAILKRLFKPGGGGGR